MPREEQEFDTLVDYFVDGVASPGEAFGPNKSSSVSLHFAPAPPTQPPLVRTTSPPQNCHRTLVYSPQLEDRPPILKQAAQTALFVHQAERDHRKEFRGNLRRSLDCLTTSEANEKIRALKSHGTPSTFHPASFFPRSKPAEFKNLILAHQQDDAVNYSESDEDRGAGTDDEAFDSLISRRNDMGNLHLSLPSVKTAQSPLVTTRMMAPVEGSPTLSRDIEALLSARDSNKCATALIENRRDRCILLQKTAWASPLACARPGEKYLGNSHKKKKNETIPTMHYFANEYESDEDEPHKMQTGASPSHSNGAAESKQQHINGDHHPKPAPILLPPRILTPDERGTLALKKARDVTKKVRKLNHAFLQQWRLHPDQPPSFKALHPQVRKLYKDVAKTEQLLHAEGASETLVEHLEHSDDFVLRNIAAVPWNDAEHKAVRIVRQSLEEAERENRALVRQSREELAFKAETLKKIQQRSYRRLADQEERARQQQQPLFERQKKWLAIIGAVIPIIGLHKAMHSRTLWLAHIRDNPALVSIRRRNAVRHDMLMLSVRERIRAFCVRTLPIVREKICRRAINIIITFVRNHEYIDREPYEVKVLQAIRQFKLNILRGQKHIRAFLQGTKDRVVSLAKQWDKAERKLLIHWFGLHATNIAYHDGPHSAGAAPMTLPQVKSELIRSQIKKMRRNFITGPSMKEYRKLKEEHKSNFIRHRAFLHNVRTFIGDPRTMARVMPDDMMHAMMRTLVPPLVPRLTDVVDHETLTSLIKHGWELSGIQLPAVPFDLIKDHLMSEKELQRMIKSPPRGKQRGSKEPTRAPRRPNNDASGSKPIDLSFRSSQFGGSTRMKR